MEHICSYWDLIPSPASFGTFVATYQTLLVGVVGLSIAATQMWIALRLSQITQQQQEWRMTEQNAAKAVAEAKVTRFLLEANRLHGVLGGTGLLDPERTNPTRYEWRDLSLVLQDLKAFGGDFDLHDAVDVMDEHAPIAYPDLAAPLVSLARACRDVVRFVDKSVGGSFDEASQGRSRAQP